MIHVFLLFVYMGLGEDKRLKSNDMYFRSVDDCVYFAQRLSKQGSNITAYCLPKLVDENKGVLMLAELAAANAAFAVIKQCVI